MQYFVDDEEASKLECWFVKSTAVRLAKYHFQEK